MSTDPMHSNSASSCDFLHTKKKQKFSHQTHSVQQFMALVVLLVVLLQFMSRIVQINLQVNRNFLQIIFQWSVVQVQ